MKIGIAALAAMMAATPVFAATDSNPFAADSVKLNLRGIDFTTVEGQQRLAIRMDQAARAVCGEGMSSIHLALGAQARGCRADVMTNIRSQIATATASAATPKATQLASR